jgi:hypothetical protein
MLYLLLLAGGFSQAGKHLGVLFLEATYIDACKQVTELVNFV